MILHLQVMMVTVQNVIQEVMVKIVVFLVKKQVMGMLAVVEVVIKGSNYEKI